MGERGGKEDGRGMEWNGMDCGKVAGRIGDSNTHLFPGPLVHLCDAGTEMVASAGPECTKGLKFLR